MKRKPLGKIFFVAFVALFLGADAVFSAGGESKCVRALRSGSLVSVAKINKTRVRKLAELATGVENPEVVFIRNTKDDNPLLGGCVRVIVNGKTYITNGGFLVEDATWFDSVDEFTDPVAYYFSADGTVRSKSQTLFFLDNLDNNVKLSRSMVEEEWDHWKTGRVKQITSQLGTMGRARSTSPTTTFALNYYKFGGAEPVVVEVPKKILLDLYAKKQFAINTYSWPAENLFEAMPPEAYSPVGIPIEMKFFGNEARQTLSPYMQDPVFIPSYFYPARVRMNYRFSPRTSDEDKLRMISEGGARRLWSEDRERKLIEKLVFDRADREGWKAVLITVSRDWDTLDAATQRRVALTFYRTVLEQYFQKRRIAGMKIFDSSGRLFCEMSADGRLILH